MMPSNVSTGRVEGRFIVGVKDGPDPDDEPDFIAAVGTIDFTASVPYLPNPADPAGPVTLLKTTIRGILDDAGYLCSVNPDGTPGSLGVRLVATDDPDLLVQNWVWNVTYRFAPVNGVTPAIPTHAMAVLSDATVDLTTVVKVPSSPGYGLPQSEAAVLRAEAAALDIATTANETLAEASGYASDAESAKNTAVAAAAEATAPTDAMVAGKINDPNSLTGTALNAAIDVQTDAAITRAPLAAFTARAAGRDTAPVPVVFVGSSSIGNAGASPASRGITHLLAAMLQTTFPLSGGATSPVTVTLATAVATPPSSPGMQVVYKSIGGSTSATYLSPTDRSDIGALAPALVLHLLGANDARNGITPATFKANLEGHISGITAASTLPVTQILVCQPPQSDIGWSPAYEYSLYQDAMKQIAMESSGAVLFINTNPEFAAIGITGGVTTDPLGVVYSDNIHPSNAGHALLADIVRRALAWETPAVQASTTASLPPTTYRTSSDGFNGNGEVQGRTTDAFQGGTAAAWSATYANHWVTAGGTLAPVDGVGNAISICTTPLPAGDSQASFVLTAAPSVGALIFMFGAQSATDASSTNSVVRFSLNPGTGELACQLRNGGVTTTLYSATVVASSYAGKRFTIRRRFGVISWIIDGVLIHSAPGGSQPSGGHTGFMRAATAAGTQAIDGLVIDALT